MVLVTRLGVTYSVDRRLYNAIKEFNVENLKKTDEFKIFLVCGAGGSGKSAFANQMCALLDKQFGLKNLGFTTSQFKKILMDIPHGAVSFDEAYRGVSRRNTLGKKQKELLQMFYEVRQLNQVIFLCTPSFFSLDEAIATELSHGMFYIYKRKVKGKKNGKKKRVFYKFFNRKKKEKLFQLSKKYGRKYNLVHTNFKGPVPTNTYVVPEAEYRKYKFESLYAAENEGDTAVKGGQTRYDSNDREARLWAALVKLSGSYVNAQKAAKIVGLDLNRGTIYDKVAQKPELLAVVGNKLHDND